MFEYFDRPNKWTLPFSIYSCSITACYWTFNILDIICRHKLVFDFHRFTNEIFPIQKILENYCTMWQYYFAPFHVCRRTWELWTFPYILVRRFSYRVKTSVNTKTICKKLFLPDQGCIVLVCDRLMTTQKDFREMRPDCCNLDMSKGIILQIAMVNHRW